MILSLKIRPATGSSLFQLACPLPDARSEALLCREFQVSRVTLRRALDQLIRAGLIIPGGRGTHHRVNTEANLEPVLSPTGNIIRVLAPFSFLENGSCFIFHF